MIKVKICGITNIEDAIIATESGAWAIGFVFYPQSPRYITPQKAKEISSKIQINKIGVFVNEKPEIINKIAQKVRLDYVQLHGTESVSQCEKIKIPYIKNIRNVNEINDYSSAFAFLVDAVDTKEWGGTGKLADWDLAKKIKAQNKTLILSGGLSIENIEKALAEVNPDYIDLSSSLEISPGVKNYTLIKEFFEKIKEIKINE